MVSNCATDCAFFAVSFILTNQASTWYWLLLILSLFLLFAILSYRLGHYILCTIAFGGIVFQPFFIIYSGGLNKNYSQISWYSGPIEVAHYLNTHLEGKDRVGSFNSGLLGFLTKKPLIVNLDGLVNNFELLEFRKQGKLREYIEKNDIQYLADFKPWKEFVESLGFKESEVELIFHSLDTEAFVVKIR